MGKDPPHVFGELSFARLSTIIRFEMRKVLCAALFLLIAAALLDLPLLFSFALVTVIVCLVWNHTVPGILSLIFWVWTVAVLVALNLMTSVSSDQLNATHELLGVPLPAFLMLAGIWGVPFLLWPVAYAIFFRRWNRP